jgi:hypothetical protein
MPNCAKRKGCDSRPARLGIKRTTDKRQLDFRQLREKHGLANGISGAVDAYPGDRSDSSIALGGVLASTIPRHDHNDMRDMAELLEAIVKRISKNYPKLPPPFKVSRYSSKDVVAPKTLPTWLASITSSDQAKP